MEDVISHTEKQKDKGQGKLSYTLNIKQQAKRKKFKSAVSSGRFYNTCRESHEQVRRRRRREKPRDERRSEAMLWISCAVMEPSCASSLLD